MVGGVESDFVGVGVFGGVGERLAGYEVGGGLDVVGESPVKGLVEMGRERGPSAQLVEGGPKAAFDE